MEPGISLRLDEVLALAKDLQALVDALTNTVTDATVQAGKAGDDKLAEAITEFGGCWSRKRESLIKEVKTVQGFLNLIVTTMQDADTRIAGMCSIPEVIQGWPDLPYVVR